MLEASEKPRSYWIHVKSIGNCEDLRLYSLGILRYRGAIFNTLIDPGYMAYPAGKVCIVSVDGFDVEIGSCGTAAPDVAVSVTALLFPFKKCTRDCVVLCL